MSDIEVPENDLADDVPPEGLHAEDEAEDPEEYEPEEPRSTETGTVYDAQGEPEMTPHDAEIIEEDDE